MPRFIENVAQAIQPAIAPDQVEQIAMLTSRGIGPLAGRPSAGLRPMQPDIEAPPRRVVDVTDHPIAAHAAAVRKVIAADRFGLARKMPRQLMGRA